jgi:hypothetical protein
LNKNEAKSKGLNKNEARAKDETKTKLKRRVETKLERVTSQAAGLVSFKLAQFI